MLAPMVVYVAPPSSESATSCFAIPFSSLESRRRQRWQIARRWLGGINRLAIIEHDIGNEFRWPLDQERGRRVRGNTHCVLIKFVKSAGCFHGAKRSAALIKITIAFQNRGIRIKEETPVLEIGAEHFITGHAIVIEMKIGAPVMTDLFAHNIERGVGE